MHALPRSPESNHSIADAAVLDQAKPEDVGLRPEPLARLCSIIEAHVAENRYPGAQVAVARHGKLALLRTFGRASIGSPALAGNETLWRLYSNTKVLIAAGVWLLVEDGMLTFQRSRRRAHSGVRASRQGRHHDPAGPHPSGRISLGAQSHRAGSLGGPRAAAPARLRHHAGMDAGLARALPPALGALGCRGADRSGRRNGFPQFVRTRLLEPIGLEREIYVGVACGGSEADARTPMSSLRTASRTFSIAMRIPPSIERPAFPARARSPLRWAWRRSTR